MNAVAESVTPLLLRNDNNQTGITTLTLNRPDQFNALSGELLSELQSVLDQIAEDASVRVVILAAGGKAFCPGHDLKQMRSSEDRTFHQALFEQCSRMMLSINRLPQPVIAQVNGVATAAGCQLVAACDLAVAAESATFAVSGINLGLFCSTPSVALSRNLSRKHAMHMLLTGEFIDAQTALEYGLVNQVVSSEALPQACQALAQQICEKSAVAVTTGKKMFYKQLELGLEPAYQYASEVMACNMDSDDAREGIDAFFQKRQPEWRHK